MQNELEASCASCLLEAEEEGEKSAVKDKIEINLVKVKDKDDDKK